MCQESFCATKYIKDSLLSLLNQFANFERSFSDLLFKSACMQYHFYQILHFEWLVLSSFEIKI